MKIINPQLSGSVYASGSFVLPSGRADQRPTSPPSGSLFFEISDSGSNLVVYNGSGSNGWEIVGKQTTPVASIPLNLDVEYLLVAGGGSGGSNSAGAGGAGGLLSSSLSSVTSGSSFTITIGAGASGVAYDNDGLQGVDSTISGTSITTITAIGGGGGVRFDNDESDGGSGGGGGVTAGQGTLNQGNDGGVLSSDGVSYTTGGGGGGALTAGGDGTTSQGGSGGNGKTSNITGTSTTYAGGGGGAGDSRSSRAGGTGGSGGGGNGGYNGGNGLTAGGANTGGGSGGNGYSSGASLSGGSGVAIFSYESSSFNCAGGIVGDAGNGRKYHQFNSSGTFKVSSTSELQIVTDNLQLHLDAGNFASRGTSTWTDLSGNGNNGTVTGATLGSDFFYTFDGSNDYITLPESAPANTSPHTVYGTFTGASETNWTLECWFKTSENDTDTWGTPIIGRDVSDLFAELIVRNNYVQYMHADPSWEYVSSTSTVTDDNWHHVVLVNYSNATMDLWLDGTKEATGVDSTINYTDTRYFKLTHVARGYNGDYTACEVAQIRLYDTNLSAAEVLQNYNATKTNFV